jgi:hypothetical protein
MDITVTEALAEVPTIAKKIAHKQQFVQDFLHRPSAVRDPHEKDGGSVELIKRELQAIADLEQRLICIRSGIARSNATTQITIGAATRTVGDWLTWRREIAETQRMRLNGMSGILRQLRAKATQQGVKVSENPEGFTDYVININEKDLSDQIEMLDTTLGTLDGQLSLRNATTTISLP